MGPAVRTSKGTMTWVRHGGGLPFRYTSIFGYKYISSSSFSLESSISLPIEATSNPIFSHTKNHWLAGFFSGGIATQLLIHVTRNTWKPSWPEYVQVQSALLDSRRMHWSGGPYTDARARVMIPCSGTSAWKKYWTSPKYTSSARPFQ